MPRANRCWIPGQIWHITDRCHRRQFLLKFARSRGVERSARGIVIVAIACLPALGSATVVEDEDLLSKVRQTLTTVETADDGQAEYAAEMLRTLITPSLAKELESELVALTKSPKPRARTMAAYALAFVQPNAAPATVQALVVALDDPDPGVRAAAAFALAAGRRPNADISHLLSRLARVGETGSVRLFAAYALLRLYDKATPEIRQGAAKAGLGELYSAVREGQAAVRVRPFASVLAQVDPRVADAGSAALIRLLDSEDTQVADSARVALKSIGTQVPSIASSWVAMLETAANDKRRIEALKLLGLAGIREPDAVRMMIGHLQQGDPSVRVAAAEALGDVRAETAVPALSEQLLGTNKELRQAAALALFKIDPERLPATLPKLFKVDPELADEIQARMRLRSL